MMENREGLVFLQDSEGWRMYEYTFIWNVRLWLEYFGNVSKFPNGLETSINRREIKEAGTFCSIKGHNQETVHQNW